MMEQTVVNLFRSQKNININTQTSCGELAAQTFIHRSNLAQNCLPPFNDQDFN